MDFKDFYKHIIFDIDKPFLQAFEAKQGDTKSRGFYVTVTQNNVEVPVTTESMTFYCEKPDKTRVYQNAVKDGNRFRIDLANQVFAVPGILHCELTLKGANGERITSKTFKMLVDRSLVENSIVSQDERGVIDDALEFAQEYIPRFELIDVELLENYQNVIKQNKVKISTVEKELSDYKRTIAGINVNQEAKQEASGYGIVNLPKNAANGHAGGAIYGNTIINLIEDTATSPLTIELDSGKVYLLIKSDGGTVNVDGMDTTVPATLYFLPSETTGLTSTTLIWDTGNIGLYELLDTETSKDVAELVQKYTYVTGTKSTIGSTRIKSVGKNLFTGELETGFINVNTGENMPHPDRTRSKNYIRVKKGETYSVSNNKHLNNINIYFYDLNRDYIKAINITSTSVFTCDLDGYVRFTIVDTAGDTDIKVQLERGDIATEYEPYVEDRAYVTAVKDGKIVNLNRVGDVADEIDLNKGKVIKRTKEIFLDGSENWGLQRGDLEKVYAFGLALDEAKSMANGFLILNDNNFSLIQNWHLDEEHFYITSEGSLVVYVSKTIIDAQEGNNTTAKFKNWLKVGTLTYQLAEPEIIPIQVSGSVVSHPSGTVYIDPATTVAGVYMDGIPVTHTDLPIGELERITVIDYATGTETELDVSQAVISDDKLLFTHPDLSNGDIVFFEYEYDVETTQGETTIQYYDSRYTIKDSVTGKFYKWEITVADGVPSIELVEV